MNKLQVYLLLHFSGILLVFFAYGSLVTRALLIRAAGANTLPASTLGGKKLGAIVSGLGLLMILVSGFGMVAAMQLGWPLWVIIKIIIWVLLGSLVGVLNRKPNLSPLMWVLTLALGLAAVATVVIRPGIG